MSTGGGGVGIGFNDITSSTHRSEARSQRRYSQAQKHALQQLTPETILQFMRGFMGPSNAALMGTLNQSMGAAQTNLARRGLTSTGFGQATLAGIPGGMYMQAYINALTNAIGLGQKRASVYAGMPIVQGVPNPISLSASYGTPGYQPSWPNKQV